MKHLIIVHSSLTFSIAKKIVQSEAWNNDSVRWVVDRNFPTLQNAGEVIDISDLVISPFRWSERSKFSEIWVKNKRSLQILDQTLSSLQSEYVVVLPHLRNFKYYALVTNKSCKGYYLMEEGILSYTYGVNSLSLIDKKIKSPLLRILYWLSLESRVPPFPMDFPTGCNFLGAFSITHLAFPFLSAKKMIPNPFSYEPELAHFENLLILGPYFEFRQLTMEIELKGLEALFNYFLRKKIAEVHYKFHPAQLETNYSPPLIRDLMQKYEQNIHFQEIEPSVSPENIAMSSKADFYLVTSSTAIYALDLGRKVYSYANVLVKFNPDFRPVIEAIPKVIRDRIIFLDL